MFACGFTQDSPYGRLLNLFSGKNRITPHGRLYFPVGQQLFGSLLRSLQHPPRSFVPAQHFEPQHPSYASCFPLRLYTQDDRAIIAMIIRVFESICDAWKVNIPKPGDHIGLQATVLIYIKV